MTNKQLQEQLSLLIIRSSLKSKYAIAGIAEENNITMMSAMIMCLLDPGQPVSMKTISGFMSCDPSNVTGMVEQLVVEGLVDRRESAQDRRIKTITLTEKGEALRDKFLEVTMSMRLPHLDTLTQEETEQLMAILEKATATSVAYGLTPAISA